MSEKLVIALLVGLLVLIGIFIVDVGFAEIIVEDGYSTSKEFVPEHTQTSTRYDSTLKITVVDTKHVPDKWFADVLILNKKDVTMECEISQTTFDKLTEESELVVKYGVGYFSEKAYCKNITLK